MHEAVVEDSGLPTALTAAHRLSPSPPSSGLLYFVPVALLSFMGRFRTAVGLRSCQVLEPYVAVRRFTVTCLPCSKVTGLLLMTWKGKNCRLPNDPAGLAEKVSARHYWRWLMSRPVQPRVKLVLGTNPN